MTYHYYTVSYLDADGEQCRSTRKSLNRWSTSSSGDLVPLFLGLMGCSLRYTSINVLVLAMPVGLHRRKRLIVPFVAINIATCLDGVILLS